MFYDYIDTNGNYGGYASKTESDIRDVIQDIVDVMWMDRKIEDNEEIEFYIVKFDDDEKEVSKELCIFKSSEAEDEDFGKLPQSAFI